MRTFVTAVAALALCAAAQVQAQAAEPAGKKLTLGVYLPTSMKDGQERFQLAEKLAASLSTALGQPVAGRSFGTYENLAKAVAEGALDFALVEGWAAAESSLRLEPVSMAYLGGDTHQRWALVSRKRAPVKEFTGKRLAITKGAGSSDSKFVTNAILAGDLDAQRSFKLVPVPAVESALKALEVNSAELALVPAAVAPKELQVLYRSRALPGPMVVSFHGNVPALQVAFRSVGPVEPFEKFVDAGADEVAELRKLITAGPGKRVPLVAESPLQRPDATVILNFREVGAVMPAFVETMEISKELPDD
jgi:hypothetical protein